MDVFKEVAEPTYPLSSHSIPIESALADLQEFLNSENNARNRDFREIGHVRKVPYTSNYKGRSSTVTDCENLLYIVDFKDDEGYAILAADDRIPESVLAVIDSGNSLTTVTSTQNTDNNPSYYSPTAPSWFKLPEYGDELFINPYNVNLYIPEANDTLVGNYNNGRMQLSGNNHSGEEVSFLSPEELCVLYARGSIDLPDIPDLPNKPDKPVIIKPYNPDLDDLGPYTTKTVGNWTTTVNKYPLLSEFTYWHQGSPYNKYYPDRHDPQTGEVTKAAVGCVPLSVAKVMAYHRYPCNLKLNDQPMLWSEISTAYCQSTAGKDLTASLLLYIAEDCSAIYTDNGTFTFPLLASWFMSNVGFDDVKYRWYTTSRVLSSLDSVCPVIVCSVATKAIDKSHCWILDGYMRQTRKTTYTNYQGGQIVSSFDEEEERIMIHCDFGWQNGSRNGYFVSGLFDFADSSYIPDRQSQDPSDTHYDGYLRTITYKNPNE